MTRELKLRALERTLSSWLDDEKVIFEEEDGYLSFNLLEPETWGLRPIRPRSPKYRLPRLRTIQEAFHWAVEAGIVEDSPEEREDFLRTYKDFAELPPCMR